MTPDALGLFGIEALTSPEAFLSGKDGAELLPVPGLLPNGDEDDDELEPDELPLLPNGDEPELDGLLPNGLGALLPDEDD